MARDSGEYASAFAFAGYAAGTALMLGVGILGWTRLRRPHLVARRTFAVVIELVAIAAVIKTVLILWAPLVLVPLFGAAIWALRRLPRGDSVLVSGPIPSPLRIAAGLGVMAGAAIATYAAVQGTAVAEGFGPALVVVTTLVGAFLLIRALWTARRAPLTPDGESPVRLQAPA